MAEIDRNEVCKWLDDALEASGFPDYGPNGLQVEGANAVTHLATATTASLATIQAAITAGADALVVHHGLFWGSAEPITGMLAGRVRALVTAHCNLLAYHLPLDAHPTHGNGAEALRRLAATDTGAFAAYKGRAIGRLGTLDTPLSAADLSKRCEAAFDHAVIHCPGGPDTIQTIGVVTGGGQGSVAAAAAAGCDAFITGETSEQTWHEAAELGCHVFACGHHATECLAIHRLGEQAAEELGIRHTAIAEINPL